LNAPVQPTTDAPSCLLCGKPTELLYPSNVPANTAIESKEIACTSPYLSLHDDIFNCRQCRLARSVPAGIENIEELYRNVDDADYLTSEPERRLDFGSALEWIEAHPLVGKPGSLLEIGSSYGLFLEEAVLRGWDVVGIEPGQGAAERCQSKGMDVFNGMLEEFDADGRRFDVVASWDVWEHLEDPVRALDIAHRLLRPDGLLVITTVNMGGIMAKVLGGRWPWYMRMHLHYFTRQSLTEMVRRAGFDVLRLSTQPKTLKLGYLLTRAQGLFGPISSAARAAAGWLGLDGRPVSINTGDIILIEARRVEPPPP